MWFCCLRTSVEHSMKGGGAGSSTVDCTYQTLCVDTWFGVILFSMYCCAASIHHIATGQNSKIGEGVRVKVPCGVTWLHVKRCACECREPLEMMKFAL